MGSLTATEVHPESASLPILVLHPGDLNLKPRTVLCIAWFARGTDLLSRSGKDINIHTPPLNGMVTVGLDFALFPQFHVNVYADLHYAGFHMIMAYGYPRGSGEKSMVGVKEGVEDGMAVLWALKAGSGGIEACYCI
jgi:hypothetical protein